MQIKKKTQSYPAGLRKKFQGSILAYSLIILAMMFAIVGSMSVVTVLDKNSAGSSQSSAQSFQVADSGVQLAIKKINEKLSTASSLDNELRFAFSGPGECINGVVSGSAGVGKEYRLEFYKNGATAPIGDCSINLSEIENIKSVGTYKNTVRAVNVAMAAPTTAGAITGKFLYTGTGSICSGGGGYFCGGFGVGFDPSKATATNVNLPLHKGCQSMSSPGYECIMSSYTPSNEYTTCDCGEL